MRQQQKSSYVSIILKKLKFPKQFQNEVSQIFRPKITKLIVDLSSVESDRKLKLNKVFNRVFIFERCLEAKIIKQNGINDFFRRGLIYQMLVIQE